MAVYRFRVFIEDDHEVYRDIDVQGKQYFADLHREIVSSFQFQTGNGATYLQADQSWYEGDEVVELDEKLTGKGKKIVSHIFDPHQRFLCQTTSYKEVWLALELQRILKEEPEAEYPRCQKSVGAPPYYTQPPPEQIVDEPEVKKEEDRMLDKIFDSEGPSEEEIERIQKQAEAAGMAGQMKAPDINLGKILDKAKSKADKRGAKEESDDFDDFDMEDLM